MKVDQIVLASVILVVFVSLHLRNARMELSQHTEQCIFTGKFQKLNIDQTKRHEKEPRSQSLLLISISLSSVSFEAAEKLLADFYSRLESINTILCLLD